MAAEERCISSRGGNQKAHDVQRKVARARSGRPVFLQSIDLQESQFWESDNRQPDGAAGCLDKNLDPPVEAAGH